ncbi:MAG: hypothetical protein ACRDAT_05340, partial [Cetobacterium sp.]
ALEARPTINKLKDLADVPVDIGAHPNQFLMTSDTGQMIPSKQHPLLLNGTTTVHMNSLGAPIKTSAGNTSVIDTCMTPYILNTGAAPRNINLGKIVGRNKLDLGAEEIREGRITFLCNSGSSAKNIIQSAGDKFYVNNAHVDGPFTVPAKSTSVYLPAIIGTTASWVFFGNYSMEGDVTGLINGFMNGSTPVSGRSVYGRVLRKSLDFSETDAKDYDTYILTGGYARTAALPNIVDFMEMNLANNQVREGKEILLINNTTGTSGDFKIKPAAGQSLTINNVQQSTTYDMKRGDIQVFKAMKMDGAFTWFQVWRHSDADVSFTQPEKDGLATLMSKGAPKFTELSDTPSGYQPGKLVGYNLSGTGMVAVEPINTFRAMTDTPGSYGGHARKVLTVKSDESGLEYSLMPNLTPINNEINTLHNSITRVDGENYIQTQNINKAVASVETVNINLESGKKLVNLNSVGQKRWTNSVSISDAAVAQRPHIFCTGNNPDQIVTLPDIVPFDSTTINTNIQVREGRATYLYNHGTQPRQILLGVCDRFGLPGSSTTAPQTLNPGTVHAYMPGINGTLKQWDLMFKSVINPSI